MAENFLTIHFSEKFVYFDNFLDIFLFMITSNNVCSVGNGMGELIYSVSLSLMMCMCVCMCVAACACVCVRLCVTLCVCVCVAIECGS